MATSIEYSVHLPVFQLPKGTHFANQISNSRQFGAFSLWRKLRWQSTPQYLRRALHSPLFHRRVQLWEIIQDLGSNSIRRFSHGKETPLQWNWRPRIATSFDALPTTLENLNGRMQSTPSTELWPFGKPNEFENLFLSVHPGCWPPIGLVISDSCSPLTSTAPSATTLPYRLHLPGLSLQSSRLSWTACATTKTQLQSGLTARTQNVPVEPYDNRPAILTNLINTWFLDGDSLHFADAPSTSIATGLASKQNLPTIQRNPCISSPGSEVMDYQKLTPFIIKNTSWCAFGNDPFTPTTRPSITTSRTRTSYVSNDSFQMPSFTMKTSELHPLRIYCPVIYFQCLTKTFADPLVFRKLEESPSDIIEKTIAEINKQFGKSYPWALGAGRDLPNAYVLPKRKKQFRAGRPIVSFFTAPFRPMLNCIAKLIYNLLPQAFPHNLAKGDVFDLIKLLKETDFDTLPTPRIHNQDLAGFFTSIDTDRFIDSWRLTLQFLSTLMSTDPDEIISVKATPGNTTGDVVKGRTCRTLNVTRKIFIRDIERIILMSLKMTQFSIGTSVFEQIRGSPMGSPLSPALCMMVVALSEEIWYRTYRTTLTTMDLSARLLRYVDNRLCLADPSWDYEICFANFLHPEFYGHPIILETEPDQEFLGFCIEFEPFALRYSPPRDFNQVMAPFSASPVAVQLSGFVSRLFLVAKCAHPAQERTGGFAALHRLYRAAGFCESDLTAAAKPIRRYLHTSSLW